MENKVSTYKYCIVPGCKSTTVKTPEKLFFYVPRDPGKRKAWIKAMRRDDLSCKTSLYCCEDHFLLENDMENYWQWRITKDLKRLCLKEGIVPHRFDCQKKSKPIERKAALKRKRMSLIEEALSSVSEASTSCDVNVEEIEVNDPPTIEPSSLNKGVQAHLKTPYRSKATNTNVIMSNASLYPIKPITCDVATNITPEKCNPIISYLSDIDEESVSETEYECESESNFSSEDEFKNYNDDKFKKRMLEGTILKLEKNSKLFLGLPPESFFVIDELVKQSMLPVLNVYVVLKKIKLNNAYSILAIDFGLSISSVSRIFAKSLPVLSDLLQELIVWPSTEDIKDWLPKPFRARYRNVCSIIDCLEIEVEKPSNPVEQSLSWSTYYNCNTMKYLVSCTPEGLVSFVSEGFGGRTSDLVIFQNSGFMKNLSSGTSVMADRGFKHISSDLQQIGCQVVRPPSVCANIKSTKEEVVLSRRIAALRILVERVIGRIREFKMLGPHSCINYKQIYLLDKAMIVACGLINMQNEFFKK